jgi:hypothetical protein
MNLIRLASESFQRIISLCDLPNVTIRVCEKDFFINQSLLPFISTELQKYFEDFDEFETPFTISIDDDDKSNPLFESVTSESLIESCSIFISMFENRPFPLQSPSSLHIPSLIIFSKKIFCPNFLSSIIDFSNSQNQQNSPSLFDYSSSTFCFNFETNIYDRDDEFSFKVCSKIYKCSSISASILSTKAFKLLKFENEFSLEIECPFHIQRRRFEEVFEKIFKLLYGFPLSIEKENIEILLPISSQIENSILLNSIIEFIESVDLSNLNSNSDSNIEALLLILEFSDFISEKIDLHSIIAKLSENFENISFDSLSNIPPSGILKILRSDDLKVENEDSLFEFLFKYSKKWNSFSFPLFSNIYFEYLKESNLSNFFELVSKIEFEFPYSIFESLSFIFKSEPRKVHKNRFSSSISTSNLNSISFFHSQIELLTKKIKLFEKKIKN